MSINSYRSTRCAGCAPTRKQFNGTKTSIGAYTSRSKFRGGGQGERFTIILLYLLICVIYKGAGSQEHELNSLFTPSAACSYVPKHLLQVCICDTLIKSDDDNLGSFLSLTCTGLNTTRVFSSAYSATNGVDGNEDDATLRDNIQNTISNVNVKKRENSLWPALKKRVYKIIIKDSNIKCVRPQTFHPFSNLQRLGITNSNVQTINCDNENANNQPENSNIVFPALTHLDISGNSISNITKRDFKSFSNLQYLNLSRNLLQHLEDVFTDQTKLITLDLSTNRLDTNLKSSVFDGLSKSLKYLNIANNEWTCSPKLHWMYEWAKPYLESNAIINSSDTRCYPADNRHKTYPLFLVMEFYTDVVLPTCPVRDQCICVINHIQENVDHTLGQILKDRSYTVQVSCRGKRLTHFPKLPTNTKSVDLSNNSLNGSAFDSLTVDNQNYDNVETLILDNNLLTRLPDKLLKIPLKYGFSAKSNQLTTISYDLSQRLIKSNSVRLSNNSWICSCDSQITDKNLMANLEDKLDMTCGEQSAVKFRNKKIVDLDPGELCPPEDNGESQELLLQLLCGVLSISIIVVLTKLGYDYSIYRRRGQLPWLAWKMP